MGILFKTYKGKHQLQIYREVWQVKQKAQLDDILMVLGKQEAVKVKITPHDKDIEIELNGLMINCQDLADLKKKFGLLADLKEKFQKVG
mgnify:CR=1 FL=1